MKNKILLIIVATAVLAGLFIVLKPESSKAPTSSTSTNTNIQPETKTFTYELKAGQVVSGQETMRVTEGDKVKITVTSDTNDYLHLHGYDMEVELKANQPAALSLDANQTGRFELELHETEKAVGALEVQPKQ